MAAFPMPTRPRTADRGCTVRPARTTGPAAADRSPAAARPGRTVRSWPLLLLAAPAAAEVWSGWVGIAPARRGSGWSPRWRASGPPSIWTPLSPSRSASGSWPPDTCPPRVGALAGTVHGSVLRRREPGQCGDSIDASRAGQSLSSPGLPSASPPGPHGRFL